MSNRPFPKKPRKPPYPKRSGKSGLPAGTLVHLGERKTEHAAVALIEYGPDALTETHFDSLDACRTCIPNGPRFWLNVHGLHEPDVLQEIGRRFKLHPLVLEDILNTDQRPKIEDYGDYLFLVTRFFDYDAATLTVTTEQVSFVIGQNFVLTFQERPTGSFDPVRTWLRQDKGRIRQLGADYLAYALLDLLVDRYFTVLEQIGEHTEQLEEDLMTNPNAAQLQTLHHLKGETLTLRRAIWPLREVINTLLRGENRFFTAETRLYLRDIYDHTVHLIESLEAIRDLIAGMLDIYLSSISNRVNQEVRALTVIAIIFMPATLISGIFGMNFHAMPLLDSPTGFLVAIGLMIGVAISIGLIFWRRRWLD
jgi:magnesium transporter